MAAPERYDADQIQVLEGLEPVRKRPGMYVGGTNQRALHQIVWELVDNSVDEAIAGACAEIVVELDADGVVTVADDGRGGADPSLGTGLRGLADRVAALGGTLVIDSGDGTTVSATFPTGP